MSSREAPPGGKWLQEINFLLIVPAALFTLFPLLAPALTACPASGSIPAQCSPRLSLCLPTLPRPLPGVCTLFFSVFTPWISEFPGHSLGLAVIFFAPCLVYAITLIFFGGGKMPHLAMFEDHLQHPWLGATASGV